MSKKSVPPKGKSPSVPRQVTLPDTKTRTTSEGGNTKPAGFGKVVKKKGN